MKKNIIIASVCIAAGLSSLNMSAESPKTGNSHNVLVVDTLTNTRMVGAEFPYDSESEKKPSFPGGEEALFRWLSRNIIYPAWAAEENALGRVVVSFVIEKDGSVSNVNAELKAHPALDAEAIRVVQSMPKWEPGTVDGEPVRVLYHLPITFKLPEEELSDVLTDSAAEETVDCESAKSDETKEQSPDRPTVRFATELDKEKTEESQSLWELNKLVVIEEETTAPKVLEKPKDNAEQIVPYEKLDQKPSFPGGKEGLLKFMQNELRYPEEAKIIRAEGKVLVVFDIEKDGAVSNIKVSRSCNVPALDEEALRAVSQMPNWSPGMLNSQPVRSRIVLPITFKLPKEEEEQTAE